MANRVKRHETEKAREDFITKTAAAYRTKADKARIREITGDAWAAMMRARMASVQEKAE